MFAIFKILSLLYFPLNLQQNSCHNFHHSLNLSLKNLKFKIQPFSVTFFTDPVALFPHRILSGGVFRTPYKQHGVKVKKLHNTMM